MGTAITSIGASGSNILTNLPMLADAFGSLINKVSEEMNNWHHYDRLLFQLYKDSNMSMREIAQGTNISLRSIFCTLKHCKERLKENVGEDFQDYVNSDYELI